MSDTLKIEIDVKQVLSLMDGLSKSAMQNAWRRTLRKTSVWINGLVAKEVSKETRIPQKILRARLYFFLRSYNTGKVWLGLNAVEADRLGAPRQTRSGVTVGRHRFRSAWIYRSKYEGKERNFRFRRRDGSMETKTYRSSDASTGKVFERTGKERTPYRRVKVDWEKQGEKAFRSVAEKAEERMLVILRQEVNYEIQKAIGRAK